MSAMQNSWRHSLGAAVLTAVVGTVVPAAPPEGSAPVPVNPPGRAAAPVASPSPVKAKEVKVYTKGVADPSGQKVWVTSTVEGGAAQILEAKELRDLFVTATAEGPGSQDGPASAAALRELVQRQQAVLQRLMAMQEKLKAQLSNRRTLSSAKERATSLYEAKAKEALTEAQKQVKSGTERLQQELSLLEAEVAKLAAEAAKMAAADEELVLTITGDRLELADPKGKGRIEAKEFRITSPEPGTAAPAQAATPPANAPGKTPKSRRIIVHAEKGPAKQPAGASAGAGLAPAAAPPDVGLAPAGATGVPASVAGEPMSAATDVRVLELAIFKLKHANAATTRDVMADLLGIERAWASGMSSMGGMGAMAGSMAAAYRHPGGTSIAVHAPSNSIIVRGPADKIAMVKEVIARIDVPPGTEPPHSKSVRVIRLKHVPAAEILEVLSSLNIRRGIGVDQQTNAIIVTGQETQLSEIEQLAKALDVPQQPGASGQPSPLQPKESKR